MKLRKHMFSIILMVSVLSVSIVPLAAPKHEDNVMVAFCTECGIGEMKIESTYISPWKTVDYVDCSYDRRFHDEVQERTRITTSKCSNNRCGVGDSSTTVKTRIKHNHK